MMEQDFSNMNDYQQTSTDDIMNQINIDSTQSLDQQIDSTLQAEDQAAIMEATTASGN